MAVTAQQRYVYQSSATPEERSYVGVYQCTTDTVVTDPVTIRDSLPALGAALGATDPHAYVVGYGGIRPAQFDQGFLTVWDAEVNYSTNPRVGSFGGGQLTDPPWLWPASVDGGGTEEQLEVNGEKDNDDRLIVNTAGHAFADELTVANSHPVLRIEKNYHPNDFNLGILWDVTYAVNSVQFWGLLPRSWRLDPPMWREQRFGGAAQKYYTVLYTFRANFRGWDLRPKNRAMLDKDFKPFKVGEHVMNTPWWLDANGDFDTNMADPIIFDGLGAHPQPFRWYAEEDFGSRLGIPTAL